MKKRRRKKISQQKLIDAEVDNTRLLSVIEAFGNSMIWTTEMIKNLLDWETDRINKTLQRLKDLAYLSKRKSEFFITKEGEDHVLAALHNSDVDSRSYMFKDEVLTGMDCSGDQTKVDNAVLPSGKKYNKKNNAEDKVIAEQLRVRARAREAKKSGISEEEYDEGIKSGRIKMCGDHIGIFDRKGIDGWQHLCKKCRKERRK